MLPAGAKTAVLEEAKPLSQILLEYGALRADDHTLLEACSPTSVVELLINRRIGQACLRKAF